MNTWIEKWGPMVVLLDSIAGAMNAVDSKRMTCYYCYVVNMAMNALALA